MCAEKSDLVTHMNASLNAEISEKEAKEERFQQENGKHLPHEKVSSNCDRQQNDNSRASDRLEGFGDNFFRLAHWPNRCCGDWPQCGSCSWLGCRGCARRCRRQAPFFKS